MTPGDLLRWCRDSRVDLLVQPDGRTLRYRGPVGVVTDHQAALISAHARGLIDLMERERRPARRSDEMTTKKSEPVEVPAAVPGASPVIQQMLAQVTAALTASAEAGRVRAGEIVAAANRYADAFERKIAAEFAARMTGTAADTSEADDAALALAELVSRLPEMQERAAPAPAPRPAAVQLVQPSPAAGAVQAAAARAWVRLRARLATEGKPVAIVGGKTSTMLADWLKARVGQKIEWRAIERNKPGGVLEAIGRDIRGGTYGLVVVLGNVASDWQANQLHEIATSRGVLCTLAAEASTDALGIALDALEAALAA
jgi:hypothetical protein